MCVSLDIPSEAELWNAAPTRQNESNENVREIHEIKNWKFYDANFVGRFGHYKCILYGIFHAYMLSSPIHPTFQLEHLLYAACPSSSSTSSSSISICIEQFNLLCCLGNGGDGAEGDPRSHWNEWAR